MSDELYPLGHEADETMYSAGELRQLLNDERARSYAAGFAAGLEQANARAERLAALLAEAALFLPDGPNDDVRQEAMEYIERLRAEIDTALAAPKETGFPTIEEAAAAAGIDLSDPFHNPANDKPARKPPAESS